MRELVRRDFLKASGAGLGAALAAGAMPAGAELPTPPAAGRSHRDPAGRRACLYEMLGDLPDRRRPIAATKRGEEERDGYVLESWVLDLNGFEPVPAFLARPKGLCHPAPAVVFDHSHGGGYDIGKKEFVEGRSYMQPVPYAKALTDEGYVALCIDHWCFGERNHTTELDTFKAMLWQGQVLWGMMVYDSIRALDWLLTRGDVDGSRIATLGMSMGSSMAQWLGALDERVKVTVDICCLTEYHTLLAEKGLERPRHLLLRAGPPEGVHRVRHQRPHRPARAPRTRRDEGRPDAPRRARHHRPRAEGGLRRSRAPGAVEAAALRRGASGDGRGAAGDPRLPARQPVKRPRQVTPDRRSA